MKVYLTVPPSADTSTVREVLRTHGAMPLEFDELVGRGRADPPRQGSVPAFWRDVDAVVAVPQLRGGDASDSVLIDVGIAIGRDIPLIVLTQSEDLIAKLDRYSVESARAGLELEDALDSHLSLFLAGAGRPRTFASATTRGERSNVDAADFRKELERLKTLTGHQLYEALETWVGRLLHGTGVTVLPVDSSDRGFDFVFSPQQKGLLRGPIVVEVKANSDFRVLEKAALKLQGVVTRERAGLGLLIYMDNETHKLERPPALPNVVAIGVYELIEALAKNPSLESFLWHVRNEVAHKL